MQIGMDSLGPAFDESSYAPDPATNLVMNAGALLCGAQQMDSAERGTNVTPTN